MYTIESKDISVSDPATGSISFFRNYPVHVYPPSPNNSKAFLAVSKDRVDGANEALDPASASRRMEYLHAFNATRVSDLRILEELMHNRESSPSTKPLYSAHDHPQDHMGLDIIR